ncbi:MAG: hypothetical protein RMJ67_06025 [Elusimicrobiota bacterium]|nr:hypothetical protein [Endomicrobiia bacterium]MDW8166050.1 hypothetical protein [Elusimicrobiota bacterium]
MKIRDEILDLIIIALLLFLILKLLPLKQLERLDRINNALETYLKNIGILK